MPEMIAANRPLTRTKPASERAIEALLFLAAALGVVTTLGIVFVLLFQSLEFFREISPLDFLTGTVWSASIEPFRFGVIPLVVGTLDVAVIALVVAIPFGLLSATYLSEYASVRTRTTVKPLLETIAGIPTIVLGFFGLNFITPVLLKPIFPSIGTFNVLSGGLVVGLLITPLIASLSEDAMRAVPQGLREGAFAMGATKWEVVRKVVFPAALSGIMASIILAMSRAIGETMAVVLTVGMNPQLSVDPRQSVETMTAFIVQISRGDTPQGSVQFESLFAVALVLFVMTFVLNIASNRIVARFRNTYS
jgi:phosphate transport system permease protein